MNFQIFVSKQIIMISCILNGLWVDNWIRSNANFHPKKVANLTFVDRQSKYEDRQDFEFSVLFFLHSVFLISILLLIWNNKIFIDRMEAWNFTELKSRPSLQAWTFLLPSSNLIRKFQVLTLSSIFSRTLRKFL